MAEKWELQKHIYNQKHDDYHDQIHNTGEDDTATVMHIFSDKEGEPERILKLLNGDIAGACGMDKIDLVYHLNQMGLVMIDPILNELSRLITSQGRDAK